MPGVPCLCEEVCCFPQKCSKQLQVQQSAAATWRFKQLFSHTCIKPNCDSTRVSRYPGIMSFLKRHVPALLCCACTAGRASDHYCHC